MSGFDKAWVEIDDSYDNGEIDDKEYKRQMSELIEEEKLAAEDAADTARDNYWFM